MLDRVIGRELEELREPLVVLLQKLECPQGFDAAGRFGGIGEFACGKGVLVDGNGRVGSLGGI